MKKIVRKIHLWLSVPFGVIITVICFSGAMLVFEKEVMELTRRSLYFVEKVEAAPLPMKQLVETVAATLPDSVSITGVSAFSSPERAYQVNLSRPRHASVYIDQYTGKVKGKHERSAFFMTMFRLHRWLLDSAKPDGGIFWGKVIVGISTLLFIFVLVSGIIIWWPRTGKILKNRLKINIGKSWRRFWYDLHVAGGMYALVFLLAMALTGLTWSFEWYRAGFYKVFGVEAGKQHSSSPKVKKGDSHSTGNDRCSEEKEKPYLYWESVYRQLALANPGYRQIAVSDGSATVSFDGWGNRRAADRYRFDARTGKITEATLYRDVEKSGKIRGWIYSVHVGSWGGMFTRILSFLAALMGACLPLTGYYLWIRRRWCKKHFTLSSTCDTPGATRP